MKKILNIIPKYARIPLLIAILMNTLVYNGSKLITNQFHHYDFSIVIDSYIPFLSVFIVIYILAYLHWIVGYVVTSRESKIACYTIVLADIMAKIVCLFCFIVIPTTIVRPNVGTTGIFNYLTHFIYSMDEPVNLFPSIHCLESYMVFRSSLSLKLPCSYKVIMGIFMVLVCLSTVFVKQHVFIDIIGGVVLAEMCFRISKIIFKKLEKKG